MPHNQAGQLRAGQMHRIERALGTQDGNGMPRSPRSLHSLGENTCAGNLTT